MREGHEHHGLLLVLGRVLVMLAHHDAEPGDKFIGIVRLEVLSSLNLRHMAI